MITVFYISAAIAALATVMVITRLNAVHALLYLIVSLLAVAVIFFSLGAPFVAALEVIIYAGAIMVLFVFVIMMLNLGPHAVHEERSWQKASMWIGPGILAAVLLAEIVFIVTRSPTAVTETQSIGPQEIGASLFGPYVIGVEIASMLLLSGLVGAFHLGRRRIEMDPREGDHASP